MLYDVYKVELGQLQDQSEPEEYEFERVEEMVKFARHMHKLVNDGEYRRKRGQKKFGSVRIHEEIFENFTKLTNSLADLLATKKQPDFTRLILFTKIEEWPEADDPYFQFMVKKLDNKWEGQIMPSIEIVHID